MELRCSSDDVLALGLSIKVKFWSIGPIRVLKLNSTTIL